VSEQTIKCFLCNSPTTQFSTYSNKFRWYNYKNKEKICSFCYYKQYHKQVKDGSFQSYKEKIGLRKCSKCGTDKTQVTITKTGYPHRKWVTDGNGGYLCHNCCKKTIYQERERKFRIKRMVEANPRILWAHLCLGNHRYNGFDVQLTKQDLAEMALKTDKCTICDVTLAWGYRNGKILRNSPSLDRINNEKEIRIDNVQILCSYCNRTKIQRTMKEFIDYCKHVAAKYH
jgi:hypothetical protein